MTERQSVRIDYFSASTKSFSSGRKIDPLLFAVLKGAWLCIAHCHEQETYRDFSLVGIKAIARCDPAEEEAYFEPPEDFDPALYFRDRFSALSGDEVYVVRLLVEPDAVPYFHRKIYHPTQQIETERDDERLVVSYEVEGLQEIASFVRSWGPGVTVLDPPKLRALIAEQAQQVLARYA